MGKRGSGPRDRLGSVPASDIDLSADVDAPSFMAEGPDVIKFDPALDRIYVACFSGAISVFHQEDPSHYRKLEDFKVQHAVHSLAVDLATHRVYTPEQEENRKPVARMAVYEAVPDKK